MSKREQAQIDALKAEGLAVVDFIESRPQRDGIKAIAVSVAVLALAENVPHLGRDHSKAQIAHVRSMMLMYLREAVALLERQA